MADPSKLDFADWFTVIATAITGGIAAGIGSAMAWFNKSKQELHTKMTTMEGEMRKWDEAHADHNTQLAVIQNCQKNTENNLEAISLTTRDTNEKIEVLNQTVMKALLAIQAKK